jgi:hypothetical protein
MKFWTGTLWVLNMTGEVMFKMVCNRWVERSPGLRTGAKKLHKLLRRHLPLYKALNGPEWAPGDYSRILGNLYEGTDCIFVYDPKIQESYQGGATRVWHFFFDGLKLVNNEVVPDTGRAQKRMQEDLGLEIKENPNAPVYTIGARIR